MSWKKSSPRAARRECHLYSSCNTEWLWQEDYIETELVRLLSSLGLPLTLSEVRMLG